MASRLYARDADGRFARTNSLRNNAPRGGRPINSLQGFRERLRESKSDVNKQTVSRRIMQLPESKRDAAKRKFIEKGITTGTLRKLTKAEGRRLGVLREADREYSRQNAAARSSGATGRQRPAAQPAAAPRPFAERLASAVTRVGAKVATHAPGEVSSFANTTERMLPGTTAGDRATKRLTQAQLKERFVQRIARLSPSMRSDAIQSVARLGKTAAGADAIRAHEEQMRNNHNRATPASNSPFLTQSALRVPSNANRSHSNYATIKAMHDNAQHPVMKQALSDALSGSDFGPTSTGIKRLFKNITPDEVMERLGRSLPEAAFRNVGVNFSNDRMAFSASGGGINSMSRRVFYGPPPNVYHAILERSGSTQGSDNNKPTFRELFKLYDKMGVEEVAVTAGLTMGGYVWAKYGFKPTPNSAHSIGEFAENFMRDHRTTLSADDQSVIRKAITKLQAGDGKGAWLLADIKTPHKDTQGLTRPDDLGNPVTVGKALLARQYGGIGSWSGKINKSDPDSMIRSRRYVEDTDWLTANGHTLAPGGEAWRS